MCCIHHRMGKGPKESVSEVFGGSRVQTHLYWVLFYWNFLAILGRALLPTIPSFVADQAKGGHLRKLSKAGFCWISMGSHFPFALVFEVLFPSPLFLGLVSMRRQARNGQRNLRNWGA